MSDEVAVDLPQSEPLPVAETDTLHAVELEEIAPVLPEPAPPRTTVPQGPFMKIPVTVQVVLGRRRMPLAEVMELGPGSVVVLDQELSQPVSLQVNGSEVARGTLSVVDETTGQLGITLTEIAAPSRSSEQH